LLALAVPAVAQTISTLTEENVKTFISRTSDVTNGKAADLAGDDIKTYLETHLHPSARFKSTMTYESPGFPSKEAELVLDKGEFMDSVSAGAQAVEKYSNTITVKEVKIASSGKSATVKTDSTEEGLMSVEGQPVPIIGQSSCDQIIMLSDEGVIQMYNANCKTVITFKEGF
jgi:hypothetical protein